MGSKGRPVTVFEADLKRRLCEEKKSSLLLLDFQRWFVDVS